ncbi:hemagglutinin repeat-containing protein [Pseudomonas soli]|uniref:Hemagglutinin repeat-containing protein n=1 Tax=Pseudomonas soli TaxID=1306993 RepID=A0AAJ5MQJ7_9PSED|nr:hemagglutinin repeat-containing protein [Pseudomonas soli]UXZ47117.1 hemagglutinin repeat-containing protein [Pseudomonas soli]
MHNPVSKIRPDTLRWAVFLALLGSTQVQAQGALTPTSGPGGTPIIDNGHGVPVIDIVAPNASGLSHNQFLDYNVGKPGLVLNNALQAGQSQLAGQLGANPQFRGHAASTILNEVVGQNASRIEGAQEIFGQKADYLLANPNGITLNGGSFINTTRAGFLVGKADIHDGQIKQLDSRDANGTLKVLGRGQSNAAGALDLIAPRIDSTGHLLAKGQLNLTIGRNLVDTGSREVLEHLPVATAIDANLLGAMQAGRIRIVSTAEGAGVQVGDKELRADRDLIIHSAGDLKVQGNDKRQARLVSNTGKLDLKADGDLQLTHAHGKARQIEVHSGKKLSLDTATREQVTDAPVNWAKQWLFIPTESHEGNATQTSRQQLGSRLVAEDSLSLKAGTDLHLTAAQLEADNALQLRSGGKMTIDAGVDTLDIAEQSTHRRYLDRTDIDSQAHTERVKASTLKGGTLIASAGADMQISGARLEARKQVELDAKGALRIESAVENDHAQRTTGKREFVASAGKAAPDSEQYSAKVGYEKLQSDEQTTATRQVASSINAGSVTLRSDRKLKVSGSDVQADTGDLKLAASEIELAAAYDSHARHTLDTRTGAALNVTGGSDRVGLGIDDQHGPAAVLEHETTARRSNLESARDLHIDATQLTTAAAQLKTGRTLKVDAEHIDNRAAADTKVRETSVAEWQGGLSVGIDYKYLSDRVKRLFGGEKAADQAASPNAGADLSLQRTSRVHKDTDSTAQVTTFDGGDITIRANQLMDEGSAYKARTGSLRIEAGEHQMLAARDQSSSEVRDTTGGGSLRVSTITGTDLKARLEGNGNTLNQLKQTTTARVGSLQGSQGVQVELERSGHYEGVRVDGGNGDITLHSQGTLSVTAASDTRLSQGQTKGGKLDVEGSSTGGGLGGQGTFGWVNERGSTANGARFDSKGTLQLTSLAHDDVALHVQGLQANAKRIGLDAGNGGLLVEAASNTERHDNLDVTLGGGLKVNAMDIGGINAQVKVGRDKRDNTTWHDSKLRADLIDLRSQGDTRIEGAQLEAQAIEGKIDGNLRVASRQDQVDSVKLKIDASLAQKQQATADTDAPASLASVFEGGNITEIAGALWNKVTAKFTPSVKIDYAKRSNDTVSQQTLLSGTQGIDLQVGGDTRLVGATLQAADGQVGLGGGAVARDNLSGRDYAKDVKVNVDLSTTGLAGTAYSYLSNLFTGNTDKANDHKAYSNTGHDRTTEYVSQIKESRQR